MSLVVLGDSHSIIYQKCSALKNYFNSVIIHHTDLEDAARARKYTPFFMNSISQRGDILLKPWIDKYRNTKVNYMMFVFGEPDIRIHFDKQINELKRDVDEVVSTLCNNYIMKLLEIIPPKIKIIVRYILPQRERSMFNVADNKYIPHGSFADRVQWTSKMNNCLKATCLKHNILFLENTMYSSLTKESGEMKDEYVDDMTHYTEKCIHYINEEIYTFCASNDIKVIS